MTGSLYELLLLASRTAHERGQHEVAYHALCGAMHAAADAEDAALSAVEAEAARQIAWIDAHAPGHRLSSASAAERSHRGVYAMLAQQVAAHIVTLEQRARHEQLAERTDHVLG